MINRIILYERLITKDLKHVLSASKDESRLFLNIDLMDGRFKIEKEFGNNSGGVNKLEKMIEKFESEEKVLKYLQIGDKNEPNKP